MNACSDGSSSSDDSTPDSACNPDAFTPTCPSETSYTACIDNTIVTKECGDKHVCKDGVCKDGQDVETECTAKIYEPTCPSDTTYTVCEEGNIVTKDCPRDRAARTARAPRLSPPQRMRAIPKVTSRPAPMRTIRRCVATIKNSHRKPVTKA